MNRDDICWLLLAIGFLLIGTGVGVAVIWHTVRYAGVVGIVGFCLIAASLMAVRDEPYGRDERGGAIVQLIFEIALGTLMGLLIASYALSLFPGGH